MRQFLQEKVRIRKELREVRYQLNADIEALGRTLNRAEPGPRTGIGLSGEQEQALRQFLQEKVRIRKELREVRYQLNADIEALGRTLKFANIAWYRWY